MTMRAAEIEERRLDLAEKNIFEALRSDDPRRRDAASMFTLRNSARAKRRGWITSSSGTVDLNINTNQPPRQAVFRWRNEDDDAHDAERAEIEPLREEGERVISIGWGDPSIDKPEGGPLIEHEPSKD